MIDENLSKPESIQMIRNSRKGTESWRTKFINKDRSNVTTRGG
jgi:hypothetical protein